MPKGKGKKNIDKKRGDTSGSGGRKGKGQKKEQEKAKKKTEDESQARTEQEKVTKKMEGESRARKDQEKAMKTTEDGSRANLRKQELEKERKLKAPVTTLEKIEEEEEEGKEDEHHAALTPEEIEGIVREMRKMSMKDELKFDDEKALVNWVRQCSKSDEELNVVRGINNRAVQIAYELSCFLVDYLHLFSECNQVMEMFEAFQAKLKAATENPNAVTIGRALTTIELAEAEVRKARQIDFISYESDEEEAFEKLSRDDRIEKVLEDFYNGIVNLEAILSHQGFPDSKALRYHELAILSERIEVSEEILKGLDTIIDRLQLRYGYVWGFIQIYEVLRRLKNYDIRGMWYQLADSGTR